MYLLNDSKHRFQVPLAVLILLASNAWGSAGAVPHHQLEVWLQARTMVVEDRLRFEHAPTGGVVEFLLGDAFDIERIDAELLSEKSEDGFSLRRYRVRLAPGQTQVSLRYRGRLSSSERSIPGSMPNLVYDDQGIYLDGQSGWYPLLLDQLVTFSLTVHQPPDWRVVSQGDSTSIQESPTHWHTTIPQDEIYLLTGPYRFYQRIGSVAKAQVFLRSDDPALAERYLNATESYLDLYSRLLGPYPFEKFAAVENRWKTGGKPDLACPRLPCWAAG